MNIVRPSLSVLFQPSVNLEKKSSLEESSRKSYCVYSSLLNMIFDYLNTRDRCRTLTWNKDFSKGMRLTLVKSSKQQVLRRWLFTIEESVKHLECIRNNVKIRINIALGVAALVNPVFTNNRFDVDQANQAIICQISSTLFQPRRWQLDKEFRHIWKGKAPQDFETLISTPGILFYIYQQFYKQIILKTLKEKGMWSFNFASLPLYLKKDPEFMVEVFKLNPWVCEHIPKDDLAYYKRMERAASEEFLAMAQNSGWC